MDALRDERGQAALVAVLAIAIAAVTLGGLRSAQDRITAEARTRRAGEAAVEAATAVIADAYTAALERARGTASPTPAELFTAVTAAEARDQARAAANAMSLANGGAVIDGPTISCGRHSVVVAIAVGTKTYRAEFDATCSRP